MAKMLSSKIYTQLRDNKLFGKASVAIIIFHGHELIIEAANRQALKLWNCKLKDIINKSASKALASIGEKNLEEILNRVCKTGKSCTLPRYTPINFVQEKLNKSYHSLCIYPLKDENGKTTDIIAMANQIPEDIITKIDSEQAKNRFKSVIKAVQLGVWEYHIISGKFYCSEECKIIYGLDSEKEISFELLQTYIHPDDKIFVFESVQNSINSIDKNYNISYRIIRPNDNATRWIKVKGKVFFNKKGKAELFSGTVEDITDEKNQDLQLREIEYQYRDLIYGLPVAIYICDEIGNIKSYNAAATTLWGRKPDLKKDKWCGSWKMYNLDGTWLPAHLLSIGEVMKTKKPIVGKEIIIERPDGTQRNVRLYTQILLDTIGKISGTATMLLDTTEQKLSQQALEENEIRLRLATEGADLGTWDFDLITPKYIHSKRFSEILGHESSKLLNPTLLLEQVYPDDLKHVIESFDKAMKTGTANYEARIIMPDKTIRWVRTQGKVLYDENNNPYRMLGTLGDITESKQNQEKIEKSELLLKTISNASPVGLWMINANGKDLFVNKTWIEWTGVSFEKQIKNGWMNCLYKDDKSDTKKILKEFFRKEEKGAAEFRIKRPDGALRWCLTEGSPYYNEKGKLAGYAGSVTDITELKKLEEQKDFFITMASHELKTPITSVKGFIQILLNLHGKEKDDFFTNSLKTIDKQIRKITLLIGELLDLSKIKSGNLQLNKEQFCINQLIKEIVSEISHMKPNYNITFSNESKCLVYADRERIGQVLSNLLTNAIKYSPTNNKINVKSIFTDKAVIVSIIDRGIGISKNDQKKIFQRFYRVEGKGGKAVSGFGIGLFIASEIIKQHDGEIQVDSELGKGTTFHFSIPLNKVRLKH